MPGIASYFRTIAAGARTTITARGTTVFVRQTSEVLLITARSTQVGAGEAGGQGVSYTTRMAASEKWFTAEEFDSVIVENSGAASTDIEILIGFGDFFRPVPDIINVQLTSSNSAVATTLTDAINIDIGQAGKEQLLPQDDTRIQAFVTALSTNAEEIRVGDTNVDTDQGTPVAAGDSLLWTSKAACFACSIATNDQAAALTVFTE